MKKLKTSISDYFFSLFDPDLIPTAVRVSLVVGSTLFVINHGIALVQGKMSKPRWFAGAITYLVPYCVNIHGQWISSKKHYH